MQDEKPTATLRFPLWIAYSQNQRVVGLFETEEGVETFRALHDISLSQYFVRDRECLLKYVKIFEDGGYSGVELGGMESKCRIMTFQEIRAMAFVDPPSR
ncbi:MAG: hypothetical protein L0Y72_00920 [Gemmataceae bacterium]|nr:hypothetical protein [Gemmataceae bacterium]MCI0737573.1 hypothetical protein [Gemmataceae bacterium]